MAMVAIATGVMGAAMEIMGRGKERIMAMEEAMDTTIIMEEAMDIIVAQMMKHLNTQVPMTLTVAL